MTEQKDKAEFVKQMATELGFALCAIADAQPTEHRAHLIDWLETDQHGEMTCPNRIVSINPEVYFFRMTQVWLRCSVTRN